MRIAEAGFRASAQWCEKFTSMPKDSGKPEHPEHVLVYFVWLFGFPTEIPATFLNAHTHKQVHHPVRIVFIIGFHHCRGMVEDLPLPSLIHRGHIPPCFSLLKPQGLMVEHTLGIRGHSPNMLNMLVKSQCLLVNAHPCCLFWVNNPYFWCWDPAPWFSRSPGIPILLMACIDTCIHCIPVSPP